MRTIIPVALAVILAGCGPMKPTKFFEGFDLESVLKKVCSGSNCRIEEVAKGRSETNSVVGLQFKYMLVSESVDATSVMTSVRSEIQTLIGKKVWGESQFKGNFSADFSFDYDFEGKKGFVNGVFVRVAKGVYVVINVRETR